MHEKFTTVAIASPGARQESLRAMLAALEEIDLVGVAGGALTGWQMVHDLEPSLVIIEGSLPDEEIVLLLNHLNFRQHRASSLVLAYSRRQEWAAVAAGASAVLAGPVTLRDIGSVVRAIPNGLKTGDRLHT